MAQILDLGASLFHNGKPVQRKMNALYQEIGIGGRDALFGGSAAEQPFRVSSAAEGGCGPQ